MHKVISRDHPISAELIYLASTVLRTLSDERIIEKMTVVPRKMVMIMWKRHAFISSRCVGMCSLEHIDSNVMRITSQCPERVARHALLSLA